MEDLVTLTNYAIAFFSLFSLNVFILLYLKHRNDYHAPLKRTGWTPVVSVVMPAYNEEKYIVQSIRSILDTDYPKDKLDIIIVDDGSKDNTLKVAKAFESPCLRVFTKQNGGKGAALNFGLAKAKGELVATMDADSYLTKETIRELIPHFEEADVMAVTPAVKVRPSDSWLKEFQRVEYLMILFSRKLLSFIDSVPVTPGPFSMFRRTVFEKVGGFDEKNLVEDQEIALRIQSHNLKIKSSMTADVYTEPPDNMKDLFTQRVRWQRGGIRNYWKYRGMIRPEYGDFGMYFVPLNFAALTAFFIVLGLLAYSVLTMPYYYQYVWFETLGMQINLMTFIGTFVVVTSTIFLWLAIRSFRTEHVKLRYLLSFLAFYWYLMLGYNLMFLFKEIRRESYSW
jgi:cellulose synthase/poly-beta-1,6-N-acetylglucosamine synthase-like glycosyltransferase